MKRFLAMILTISIVICVANYNIFAANEVDSQYKSESVTLVSGFSGGDGSIKKPYVITTAEQLMAVNDNLSSSFILGVDLDMSKVSNFSPIGSEETPFTGTFNGNGHVISNLSVSGNTVDVGFFGYTKGATISKLGLKNVNFSNSGSSGYFFVGGIASAIENTRIENCFVEGTVSCFSGDNGYSRAGGIAAYAVKSNIINCYSNSTVYASGYDMNTMVGGLVAWMDDSLIDMCYVAGEVTGVNEKGVCYAGGANASAAGDNWAGYIYSDSRVNNSAFLLNSLEATGAKVFKNDVGNIARQSNNRVDSDDTFGFDKSIYEELGWDFDSVWYMSNGYPKLLCFGIQGKVYAPGYNPETDRYSFRNIVDVVDEEIYIDIYGDEKGAALYRRNELDDGVEASHGLCYGMATTTAGYLMDVPRVNTVINSGFLDFVWNAGDQRQNIFEIEKTDLCTTMNLISVRTFIKYAFAIQCATVLDRNNRDCDDIYDAVYDYVFNDGVPVTIDLYVTDYDSNHKEVDTPFAHTVLAVGLDGDNGIIVDDSNCDDLTTIRFEKDQNGNFNGKWSYDVYPELMNGNNNHVVNNRYVRVMYHTQTASVWADAVLQNITVLDSDWVSGESTENAVWGVKKYKSDYNLVIVDSDEHQIKSSSENGLSEIAPIMSGDSNTSNDKAKLYWSHDADQLTIDGVDGGEVSVIGNKNVITSNLSKDECAMITLDERNGNVSTEIDAGADGIYNLNLKTSDKGKKTFMQFDGTTDSGSVNVTKTNAGAMIEGSGAATLTIMEGDSVKASEVVEHSGYVGVKYDEVKEEIETYLVGDANGDDVVNLIDLTLVAQYIAQGGVEGTFDLSNSHFDAMDARGDGIINQLDLNAISRIILAQA